MGWDLPVDRSGAGHPLGEEHAARSAMCSTKPGTVPNERGVRAGSGRNDGSHRRMDVVGVPFGAHQPRARRPAPRAVGSGSGGRLDGSNTRRDGSAKPGDGSGTRLVLKTTRRDRSRTRRRRIRDRSRWIRDPSRRLDKRSTVSPTRSNPAVIRPRRVTHSAHRLLAAPPGATLQWCRVGFASHASVILEGPRARDAFNDCGVASNPPSDPSSRP